VQDRIETFMGIGDEDMHDAYNEASKTIRRLYRETERKITQLDVATVSVSHVMQMMRSYEDQGETHRAVQFAATWMSNLAQADRDEIMLAAGYALPERDQLLRECVHGAMLTTDCCLECDCGIEDVRTFSGPGAQLMDESYEQYQQRVR
jgi:hypothetical protein